MPKTEDTMQVKPRKPITPAPNSYAFPGHHDAGMGEFASHPGMSLRDWFAGRAMGAFGGNILTTSSPEHIASKAYAIADAMLVERERVRAAAGERL